MGTRQGTSNEYPNTFSWRNKKKYHNIFWLEKHLIKSYFYRVITVFTLLSFQHPINRSAADHNNCRLLCNLLVILKVIFANSVDQDQTAPLGAVWSGSTLFACMPK